MDFVAGKGRAVAGTIATVAGQLLKRISGASVAPCTTAGIGALNGKRGCVQIKTHPVALWVERLFRHQKNLSGTMIVSPGRTISVSLTLTSTVFPFSIRTI